MKKVLFLIGWLLFAGQNMQAQAMRSQRIPVDGLYSKGTWGIETSFNGIASINSYFIKGYHIYDFYPALGVSYFFKKRWSAYINVRNYFSWSSMPDSSPNRHFISWDIRGRYHVRNWYFGSGFSYGNYSYLTPSGGEYAPRKTSFAFANVGLHMRTSPHKKFWKDTFFVADFVLGKILSIEQKPDGRSSAAGFRPAVYIGLHYLIKRKK